jgi:glutamate carboxypeptidase
VSEPLADLPAVIRDRAVGLLQELCAISSASDERPGLWRMAERLGAEFNRFGLDTAIESEADEAGERLPVLVVRGSAARERFLLLVGHLDTVLAAAEPHVNGTRLLGTGALDMKGGLVTLVAALDLLAHRGHGPPADLLFLAVPDEEVGGVISKRVMLRWGGRARAALVLEPGERREGSETLVAGRRGLAEWRLDVRGRSAHSGLAYWDGSSALAAACAWSMAALALARPGPGVTVNVARLVGGDADFVDALAANHDLVGSSRRLNVVPERAVVEGEVRFLQAAQGEATLAELRRIADAIASTHGVDARFEVVLRVAPVEPGGAGSALVERTVALAAQRGFSLVVEEDRGGISFPNFLAAPGLPVVDGLGPVGNGMHTRDEYVDLVSLERRIVLLADLLETL